MTMFSIQTVTLSAIVLLGLINGYCGQICNITTPFNNRGVIQQKVTLGCCPGYSVVRHPRLKQTYCKPKCDKSCHNGRCTAPNTCTCKEGYEFASEYTKTFCVPKCDSCVNGNCILPNVCQCRLKFHKNEEGVCVPNCDPECVHAKCSAPNVCQCNPGYQPNGSFTNICDPVCDSPCANGYCSAVNTCTCWDGFKQAKDDPRRCVQEGEEEEEKEVIKIEEEKQKERNITCLNGTLIPNDCLCPEDHHKIKLEDGENEGFECEEYKSCDGKCSDKECSLIEQCKCVIGYFKEIQNNGTFKCLPTCEKECQNGSCISPNTCKCFDGFEKSPTELHICQPVCPQGCENGFCSAPKQCSCNEGYELDANINICRPECDNCTEKQDCVAPGKCECNGSYQVMENGDCGDQIVCNFGAVYQRRCMCMVGYFLDGDTCRREEERAVKETTMNSPTIKDIPRESITTTEKILQTTISEDDEEYVYLATDSQILPESQPVREFPSVTESDMEILTTTAEPFCKNGKSVNGKCICPKEYFSFADQECVLKSAISYVVNENIPKCPKDCLSGECFTNGTCKCAPQFKLSPDDSQKCIPMPICEICLINDSFPCPTHCFSTEYSPSRQSSIPQYLIITVACLITLAMVILGFSFYKRMQKRNYYTGPVDNSVPIYAYELETLT